MFAKGVLDGDRQTIPEVTHLVLATLSNQLVALHLRVRLYEMRMRLPAIPNTTMYASGRFSPWSKVCMAFIRP